MLAIFRVNFNGHVAVLSVRYFSGWNSSPPEEPRSEPGVIHLLILTLHLLKVCNDLFIVFFCAPFIK